MQSKVLSTSAKVKFAPLSLSNLAGTPNTEMNRSYSIHVTVLAFWSLVINAIEYLVKWSVMTSIFFMLGGWFNSIVVSMLVKST